MFELARASAHGIVQGAAAELGGGEFRDGFLGGSVGSFGGHLLEGSVGSTMLGDINMNEVIAAAVVGGTAAELGGGKFANGAYSAAFSSLVNQQAQANRQSKAEGAGSGDGFRVDAESGRGSGASGSGSLDPEIESVGVMGSINAAEATLNDPDGYEYAGEIYRINDPNKADLVSAYCGDSSVVIDTGPHRGVSTHRSIVNPERIPGFSRYFVAGYHSHPPGDTNFSGSSRFGTNDYAVPKAGFPLFMGTSTGRNRWLVKVALPIKDNRGRFVDRTVFSGRR